MIAKAISLIFNEVDRYYLIREIDKTLTIFKSNTPFRLDKRLYNISNYFTSQTHVKLIMSVFEYHKLVLFSEDIRK